MDNWILWFLVCSAGSIGGTIIAVIACKRSRAKMRARAEWSQAFAKDTEKARARFEEPREAREAKELMYSYGMGYLYGQDLALLDHYRDWFAKGTPARTWLAIATRSPDHSNLGIKLKPTPIPWY
jgi:hypothetical protein